VSRAILAVVLLVGGTLAAAQERYLASPNRVALRVGETQRVQILDGAGKNATGVVWTVEPEDVASISEQHGLGLILAKAPGKAVVTGEVRGTRLTVSVEIFQGEFPPGTKKWSIPELVPGTRIIEQLQARQVSKTTPAFYVQEGNEKLQYLRAIDEDGIQQWVWPGTSPNERLRLRCGDNFGGAVLTTERDGQFYATVLKQDGTERWRQATAPWWAYTYTAQDVLYIVEDDRDLPGLTAFDGDSGERKLSITFPINLTQHIGYEPPPGGAAVCKPGESTSKAARSSHGSLVTDENGIVHVAVTTLSGVFDASGCVAQRPVDKSRATLQVETHIQLLSVAPEGESSWLTIRRLPQKVTGWEKPTQWLFPWGSTIPDGHGGVLVPVRGQIGSILTGKTLYERGAIFRVNQGVVTEYHLPVLPPVKAQTANMVLGEDDRGFFGGDKSVVAYNVSTGKVEWVWKYDEPVEIYAALADGGVVVNAGVRLQKFIRLDREGKVAEVIDGGEDTLIFR